MSDDVNARCDDCGRFMKDAGTGHGGADHYLVRCDNPAHPTRVREF